jgi:hypothetical protein
MNVEIGTEAAQFPEKEYINGILVAVHTPPMLSMSRNIEVQTTHIESKHISNIAHHCIVTNYWNYNKSFSKRIGYRN